MAAIELDLNPDRKTLKQFGFIALGAFCGLAALVSWRGGLFGFDFGAAASSVVGGMLGLGLLSALLSVLRPEANRPLWVVLVCISFPIGFLLSHLALGLLFFGIITPIGILFRLFRRDLLRLKMDPAAESYWIECSSTRRGTERYFKQF